MVEFHHSRAASGLAKFELASRQRLSIYIRVSTRCFESFDRLIAFIIAMLRVRCTARPSAAFNIPRIHVNAFESYNESSNDLHVVLIL